MHYLGPMSQGSYTFILGFFIIIIFKSIQYNKYKLAWFFKAKFLKPALKDFTTNVAFILFSKNSYKCSSSTFFGILDQVFNPVQFNLKSKDFY